MYRAPTACRGEGDWRQYWASESTGFESECCRTAEEHAGRVTTVVVHRRRRRHHLDPKTAIKMKTKTETV
jgi:hypothetical protein